MDTKTCGCCQLVKLKTEFSVKDSKRGTLQSKCKECVRSYGKRHYQDNKAEYVARAAVRNEAKRQEYTGERDVYLAQFRCSDCGGKKRLQLVSKGDGRAVHEIIAHQARKDVFEKALRDSTVRCLPCIGKRFGKAYAQKAADSRVANIAKRRREALEKELFDALCEGAQRDAEEGAEK